MGFELSSKTLSIALFALVVLSLSTNVLLYIRVQKVQEQLLEIQTSTSKTIHTHTLHWERQNIPAGKVIQGYVGNWTVEKAVKILQIEVWMGNPYDVLWEGDTFVSLNNTINDLWSPPPDTVLVHYQFDSHDKSPVPHQKSFDLRPGFHIDAGETLYVYRLFNNFDQEDTESGDAGSCSIIL